MLMWSNEKIEQWRLAYSTYLSDMPSVTFNRNIDRRRPHTQQEMTQLLRSFLDGAITLKEFNTVFQQKTHNAWNVFHLQGMSGGLFLNKLVKHIPSEDTFGHLFRLMLRVPEEAPNGRRQMQAFIRFLEGLIASHQITRAQLQPGRVPFFLILNCVLIYNTKVREQGHGTDEIRIGSQGIEPETQLLLNRIKRGKDAI